MAGRETPVPTVRLGHGPVMPRVGLGLWRLSDDQAQAVVGAAVEIGYRLFDTGDLYRNEAGLGRAIAESGLAREEVFVISKAWAADGYDITLRAFDASIARLGLDVLDLYLVHWPRPEAALTRGAWLALEWLLGNGRCRAIGVSNFQAEDLDRLLSYASIPPAVNQIQLHPWCSQARQRAINAEHGIMTQAWGPLGRGRGLLDSPVLARVAAKHGRSPAQVVLRWQLQLGNTVIPKTSVPERLRQNIDVFDFELDERDLAAIALLDEGRLVGSATQPRDLEP
jgi:2,5-diketo-D-gluconate reductase A